MKNWLLNPSGLPNRFVEMDLVQERLNLRVKVQIFLINYELRSLIIPYRFPTRLAVQTRHGNGSRSFHHVWSHSEIFRIH